MKHHNLPPYATWEEAAEGARAVIAHRPGSDDPDVKCAVKGALTVADFAASMIPSTPKPEPFLVSGSGPAGDQFAELLDEHFLRSKGPSAAMPWGLLFSLAMAAIQEWLRNR